MKSKSTLTIALLTLMFLGFGMVSFTVTQQQPKPWTVPQEFKTMKNPVKADAESVQVGKNLYMKMCASCHGKTGKGDGPKARTLDTYSGDFTSAEFKNQADGELFYKTKMGRGDMPKYENKIPDEDIWNLVNYMKSL